MAIDYVESLTRKKLKTIENSSCLSIKSEPIPSGPKSTDPNYINDIEIYNKLMFALAKNGNTKQIMQLFNKLKNMECEPNLNTYVAAIQSLGHNYCNNNDASVRLRIERILIDLKKANVI